MNLIPVCDLIPSRSRDAPALQNPAGAYAYHYDHRQMIGCCLEEEKNLFPPSNPFLTFFRHLQCIHSQKIELANNYALVCVVLDVLELFK